MYSFGEKEKYNFACYSIPITHLGFLILAIHEFKSSTTTFIKREKSIL